MDDEQGGADQTPHEIPPEAAAADGARADAAGRESPPPGEHAANVPPGEPDTSGVPGEPTVNEPALTSSDEPSTPPTGTAMPRFFDTVGVLPPAAPAVSNPGVMAFPHPAVPVGPQPGWSAPAPPSWAAYAAPMRDVRDGSNPALHSRYWEAQLVAAARGSLHWGFLAFFVGFGSYYLVSLLFGAVLSNDLSHFDAAHPPRLGPSLLLLTFAPNVLLGLAPAVFSWWKGHGLRSDFGIVPTLRDLRVGLACGGVALVCAWVLTAILTKIRGHDNMTDPLQTLSALSGGKTVWLALAALFLFLGAPVTEELLVRGALWGALEHYRVPRFVILALTALIFAFLHGEPARTLVLFVQGVALGVARMTTGRIGSSMVAHATNNLLPAMAFYFLPA